MNDIQDEITLELARLQRAAFDRVRKRNAEQQLGEAWVGLLHDQTQEPPAIRSAQSLIFSRV
jgi:hypothetical protein